MIFATTGVIVGWNHLFVLLQLIIWEVLLPRLFYWIMAVLVDDGGELEPVTREIFATTTWTMHWNQPVVELQPQ